MPRVRLYSTEVVEYQWDLVIPPHIDPTDADAIWDWANDEELLHFDECEIVDRNSEVEPFVEDK